MSTRLESISLKGFKTIRELPDDQIDAIEIAGLLDWSNARRGLFYRPVKQRIILRQHVERCQKEKTG